MMHVEAETVFGKLAELYPAWNPTATQAEAIKHKLAGYDLPVAERAVLDTYNPAKRVAPVAELLTACAVHSAKAKQAAAMAADPQAAMRTCSEQEMQEMMLSRARAGDAFAREMCRRRQWMWQDTVNSELLSAKGV